MSQQPAAKPLLAVSRAQYQGPYDEHLFDQYKLLVQSAERISERRSAANTFLLAVNTALAAVHAFASAAQPGGKWGTAVPIVGLFLSITWWFLLASYRNVNRAKWDVVTELEDHLPARPYAEEWRQMSPQHVHLSKVEQWVPAAFGLLYLTLAVYSLRN